MLQINKAVQTVTSRGQLTCNCTDHNCQNCDMPRDKGRLLFECAIEENGRTVRHAMLCGDCIAGGVPRKDQPYNDPHEVKRGHAWETPAADGVGTL